MSGGESATRIRTRAAKAKNGGIIDEDHSEDGQEKSITDLSELHVGMKLEAMDKYGKWYVAKVMEFDKDEKEVLVHFEKWSSRYDEFIPLNSGRLHFISQSKQEEMEKEKEKIKKQLTHGDRIQAKWTDGRMYFGIVVKLNDGDVDLLFDDGVTYTAPLSHVRKRLSIQSTAAETPGNIFISTEERRFRAEKRKRSELSSSPSSSSPSKKRQRISFDSSWTLGTASVRTPRRGTEGDETVKEVGGVVEGRDVAEDGLPEGKCVVAGGGGVSSDEGVGGDGGEKVAGGGCKNESKQSSHQEARVAADSEADKICSEREEEKAAEHAMGRRSKQEENKVVFESKEGQKQSNKVEEVPCGEQGGARTQVPPAEEEQVLDCGAAKKQLPEVNSSSMGAEMARRRSRRGTDRMSGGDKQGESRSDRKEVHTRSRAKKDKEDSRKLQETGSGGDVEEQQPVEVGVQMSASESILTADTNLTVGKPVTSKSDAGGTAQGTCEMEGLEATSLQVGQDCGSAVEAGGVNLDSCEELDKDGESKMDVSVGEMMMDIARPEPEEVTEMNTSEFPLEHSSSVAPNVGGAIMASSNVTLSPKIESPTMKSPRPPKNDSPNIKSPQSPNSTSLGVKPLHLPKKNESSSVKPSSRMRRTGGTSSSSLKSSVITTRTRAHVDSPKQIKPAATASLLKQSAEWDHNEFKCKYTGCTKSFRKSTLLASHVKHYHAPKNVRQTRQKKSPTRKTRLRSPKPMVASSSLIDAPEAGVGEDATKTASLHSQEELAPSVADQETASLAESGPSVTKKHSIREHSDASSSSLLPSRVAQSSGEKPASVTKSTGKSATKSSRAGQKGDASSKKLSGGEVVSIARVAIKAVPPVGGVKWAGKRDVQSTSSTSTVTTTTLSSSSSQFTQRQSVIVESTGVQSARKEEGTIPTAAYSAKLGTDEESIDDIVHCVCGSDLDEGFMIQCEECLCWQHGDCIGIRSVALPKKYTCYICANPPGIRTRLKYKYSRDWYEEGSLPNLPGGSHFPPTKSKAVLLSHELTDSLYRVKKMMHSTDVKLQAASNPNHPYLKQWGKECNHYDKDALMAYSLMQLQPFTTDQVDDGDRQESTGRDSTSDGGTLKDQPSPMEVVSDGSGKIEGDTSDKEKAASTLTVNLTSTSETSSCIDSMEDASKLLSVSPCVQEVDPNLPAAHTHPDQSSSITTAVSLSTDASSTSSTVPSSTPQHSSDNPAGSQANSQAAETAKVPQNLATSTEPKIEPAQEELMEIINQDEFGISEVPVFAVEPSDRLPQPSSSTLPPVTIITAPPPVSLRLGGSGGAPSSSFSPSAQSAFKPVPGSASKHTPSNTKHSANSEAGQTTPGVAKKTPSPMSGVELVTVGEFSEAFLKGDTTNWFRRMKLLDHIEQVQDNMHAWLDTIEKKLADLPDDGSDTTEKLLLDLQSSLQKLRTHPKPTT